MYEGHHSPGPRLTASLASRYFGIYEESALSLSLFLPPTRISGKMLVAGPSESRDRTRGTVIKGVSVVFEEKIDESVGFFFNGGG